MTHLKPVRHKEREMKMDKDKFETTVKKRANQLVQKKIQTFRRGIKDAFEKLTGSDYLCETEGANCFYSESTKANWRLLSDIIESGSINKCKERWPAFLWKEAEEKVTQELFSVMDAAQKALIAPEISEDDDKPDTTA